jgi:hypothetical protein
VLNARPLYTIKNLGRQKGSRTRAAHGLTTDDWFFHIDDETLCPEFLTVAKAMTAHNGQIQIFSDAIGAVDSRT